MISHSYNKWRRDSSRVGMTLIELLVVIAIIAVLLGIIGAVSMKVLNGTRVSASQNQLIAMNEVLKRQWQAVINQAKIEPIPDAARFMAGNGAIDSMDVDPGTVEDRARIIWIKLRLRQEFPQTFGEAFFPWNSSSGCPAAMSDLQTVLTIHPSFAKAFLRSNGTAMVSPSSNPVDWQFENAICTLIALKHPRASVTMNEDSFGPYGTGSKTVNVVNPQTGEQPTLTLTYPTDNWGGPINLYRWPVDNGILDRQAPVAAGLASRDPLDPRGLLLDPNWNKAAKKTNSACGVYWFERYCHAARSAYAYPALVSSGPDSKFGYTTVPGITGTPALIPQQMTGDGTDAADDNLFQYKISG